MACNEINEMYQNQACIFNVPFGFVCKLWRFLAHCHRSNQLGRYYHRHTLCITAVKAAGVELSCFTKVFFGSDTAEHFRSRRTDMLSKNNWNRRAKTDPSRGAYAWITLALRPFRPETLKGLRLGNEKKKKEKRKTWKPHLDVGFFPSFFSWF